MASEQRIHNVIIYYSCDTYDINVFHEQNKKTVDLLGIIDPYRRWSIIIMG